MDELKPCPFCGGDARTDARVTKMGGGTDHVEFSVSCTKCGTRKTIRLEIVNSVSFENVKETIDDTVKLWNTRVNCD